jgi:hypothetical protein
MAKRFDVVDVTEPEVVENEAGDKVVVSDLGSRLPKKS